MFTHFTEIGDRFGYNGLGDAKKSFPAELDKFGVDSLGLQIRYAREHHKEIFWSLRMNDSHDSSSSNDSLHPSWKDRHPDALMGSPESTFSVGGSRWSTLNYALPMVRDHIFNILQEVCVNYDIDGVELDFFRHPLFFKEVLQGEYASQESVETMTRFIRRIRSMTEEVSLKRGRPLLIAIKIPDSLDYCRAIGLDVQSWLTEELIDILAGGGYFKLEPWRQLADTGKKYHVPVYAAVEARSIMPDEYISDRGYILKRFRGEALAAWNSGVDGVYTYNLWFNRNSPTAQLFRELGDPEILKKLERIDGESYVMDTLPPQFWLRDGYTFLRNAERYSDVRTDAGLSSRPSRAIKVLNPGFEEPEITHNRNYLGLNNGAPGSGWEVSAPDSTGNSVMIFRRGMPDIPDGFDGSQFAVLTARKESSSGHGKPNRIYQQVIGRNDQERLSSGDVLRLTVSLAGANRTFNRNFSFGLYADSSLQEALAESVSTSFSPLALSGFTFSDFSVHWTAGEQDSGRDVYIGFKSEDYGMTASSPRLAIDNVRLELIHAEQ